MDQMKNIDIVALPAEEFKAHLDKVFNLMNAADIDYAIIRDNANLYYLTGRVFRGYIYLDAKTSGYAFGVKAPNNLSGDNLMYFRKPADFVEHVVAKFGAPETLAFELDSMAYSNVTRLAKSFGEIKVGNISGVMRQARSTKTAYELEKIRRSGVKHTHVYEQIPGLYQPGMSDIELQIEIERTSRLSGCLGQFRINGGDMEIFMGNVLTGENGDTPSPYDFAMGGQGLDPSIPVGANGTVIRRGATVMVDVNGNYTGYMTDMTRCFSLGTPDETVVRANELSIAICNAIAEAGRPGVEAKSLYELAANMAKEAGMEEYFMGYTSHAGFVGHGIGIEINEAPVIAPRSRDILAVGNVIAVEPKFVIPGFGAVGIENTYAVTENGPMECLTHAPENIINLD
jgi:Xaa-Pro aminopeptidase